MLKEKVDALRKVLGGDESLVNQVLTLADGTEKAANAAGIRFKEVASQAKAGETFDLDGATFVKLASGEAVEIKAAKPSPKVGTGDAPQVTEDPKLDAPYSEDEATDETPIGKMSRKQLTDHIAKCVGPQMDKMSTDMKALFATHAKTKEAGDAAIVSKLDEIGAALKTTQGQVAELAAPLPTRYAGGYRSTEKGAEPNAALRQSVPHEDPAKGDDDMPFAKHFKAIQTAAGAPAAQ